MEADFTYGYFLGNTAALGTLSALTRGGRIIHSFLVTGEKGVGKKTFARLMAAAFLCKNEDKPCFRCGSCGKIFKNEHPDVTVFDAGEGKSFGIEAVRDIKRASYVTANEADYKVYILADCESMTVPAQNALLKLLEEPPADVILILTASDKSALLSTVLSRVAEIPLFPLSEQQCENELAKRMPQASREDISVAARVCGGNLGRALQMLSSPQGTLSVQIARDMVRAAGKSEYDFLLAAKVVKKDKVLLMAVLSRLKLIYRDILSSKLGAQSLASGEENIEAMGAYATRAQAVGAIEKIERAEEMLTQNVGGDMIICYLCTKLCT